MSSWAQRMHRRAATLGTVVSACAGHPAAQGPFLRRIDKVKFGVSLTEVCKNDIPGPLLVLILKLNKEAPGKRDVFRAPGPSASVKRLSHFLSQGRLVNMDAFSVHTLASVLKRFLRKVPGGIFGKEAERQLMTAVEAGEYNEVEEGNSNVMAEKVRRIIQTLPPTAQRLLVLIFGTLRAVAISSERLQTGMSAEALAVSVAPSFFHSCVGDGKRARVEDVARFKEDVDVATRAVRYLIEHFGSRNLFGRSNYEFYARLTGRVLRVEEDWILCFRSPIAHSGLGSPLPQEDSQSTPALLHVLESGASLDGGRASTPPPMMSGDTMSLGDAERLSASLEEGGLFLVHERQTARMKTRSEWFLSPPTDDPFPVNKNFSPLVEGNRGGLQLSASADSVKAGTVVLVRRSSSRDKERHRLVRRTSSKKDKENGAQHGAVGATQTNTPSPATPPLNFQSVGYKPPRI